LLLQAAVEGNVAAAQALWAGLQGSGLPPSRRFMHSYLM
jgi:hypothetical protein